MKANYKNWVPNGLLFGMISLTILFLFLFIILGLSGIVTGIARIISGVVSLVLFLIFLTFSFYCIIWHHYFSYNGKKQMSRHIIEGIAKYVEIPEGGKCLDIGCGSAALSIAVAKRNKKATVTGLDRWGKEYASFSQKLCENNAKAEGVEENT